MGMSAVYTDREFSSSEMRDGKSLTNNNVLPKNILSEEEDEDEGEGKSEEGEEKMRTNCRGKRGIRGDKVGEQEEEGKYVLGAVVTSGLMVLVVDPDTTQLQTAVCW